MVNDQIKHNKHEESLTEAAALTYLEHSLWRIQLINFKIKMVCSPRKGSKPEISNPRLTKNSRCKKIQKLSRGCRKDEGQRSEWVSEVKVVLGNRLQFYPVTMFIEAKSACSFPGPLEWGSVLRLLDDILHMCRREDTGRWRSRHREIVISISKSHDLISPVIGCTW